MPMKIELRNGSVYISGYVNATDRESKPITDPLTGKHFTEKILPGAFRKSLEKNGDVSVMHNHKRVITSIRDENIQLYEDNVGLYFEGEISDKEIVEKARERKLVGWSFGFFPTRFYDTEDKEAKTDFKREISELSLIEVSILDNKKTPAYPATSIHIRQSDEGKELKEEIFIRGEENAEYFEDKDANERSKSELELRKRKLELLKK